MRVAIRVDASSEIGSGHVMRCLALAEKLRRRGGHVRFFCRSLPGDLAPLVSAQGYPVTTLSFAGLGGASPSWEADAGEMLRAMAQEVDGVEGYDWLVVDHYALDARWERGVRRRATRLLVLDDLADRPHDCDLLIDANYLPELQRRYDGKVPPSCRTLLGPEYALLREEFYRVRPGTRDRILVSFGGHDVAGLTPRVARVLAALAVRRHAVDLVVGREASSSATLADLCARTADFTLNVQVSNLAELMSRAVLCVGGGGITTLERLFLEVPTIAVAATAHEEQALQALGRTGYLRYLGSHRHVSDDELAAALTRQLTQPEVFRVMSFPPDDSWVWQELHVATPAHEARDAR
jgi:UDP-2,4-diacetamido-2,4,6-trideoxy-beta-L-altropyranose hydrolase